MCVDERIVVCFTAHVRTYVVRVCVYMRVLCMCTCIRTCEALVSLCLTWAGKGEPHFVILHKLSIIQLCGAVGCKAVQAHTVVVGAFKHHHQRTTVREIHVPTVP